MGRMLVLVVAMSIGVAAAADAQGTARPTPKKSPATRRATPAPAPVAKPPAPPEPPAPPPPPPPPTDIRVVTAYTQGAQVSQNTTYIRGPRQRVEFPGLVSIDQCDLQRSVMLSPAVKRYRVQPYSAPAAAPVVTPPAAAAMNGMPPGAFPGAFPGAAPQPRGGVVVMTTTLTDTLERQTMFGLEARRIKTVIIRQPSKDACEKTPGRTEIDAWYVDLPATSGSCARASAAPAEPSADADSCQDRVESRLTGDVTLGFPVKTTTTVTTGEGDKQETSSTSAEATALEITRLDAALFDVPADFVEAKSLMELTPSVAAGGTLADAIFGSTANGTSQAAPKRAGVLRIGVLEPVNKSGRASLPMSAVRQELVTRLTKAPYEALPLNGSTVQAVTADMARLECDYVLVADVVEAKTSKPGRVGGMLKMASGGGPSKDKHEVKMAYRLYPADGSATIKAQGDVKADNGGGFGIGSALRMAAFAGQMYMGFASAGMMRGFGGMGGLGMGMGMMNPMYSLAASGGMGAMGGGFYDPRSMALTSMAMGFASGMGGMSGGMSFDPADQEVFQVASEAAADLAKATTDALKKGKESR